MDNIYLLVFYSILAIFILVTFFLLMYIRNQNVVWQQRKQFQETEIKQQKELLSAVIDSQEIERKRIGEDLHDEVGGTLSAIKLMLNAALRKYSSADQELILPAKQLIDKIIVDVRNISHDLSPPGLAMFGLNTSIEAFASLINKTGEIEVIIDNQLKTEDKLLAEKSELALFRVITQLIANTLKHANATKINILFKQQEQELIIEYQDNGKGFDIAVLEEKKGIGMQNIFSRLQMVNATYKITSAQNKGFKIEISCKTL
ncbi:MAG: hypothetical protein EOP00_09490 [Pedobacter sp.]|nr:MAG: hypothetical protein EOP00_09490 [Pedobacter sp.]